jgi:hypothetical protein
VDIAERTDPGDNWMMSGWAPADNLGPREIAGFAHRP